MDGFIKIMKALADPNRVKIIKMLQHKPMCVCEIQTALQISQPAASKHLKILENAGFVYSRKEGLWVNYHLGDGKNSPYVASLLENFSHWLETDSEIVQLMEVLPDIRRERICHK